MTKLQMKRIDVTFASQGNRCAAWLYLPSGAAPFPCVILANGLAAVVSQNPFTDGFTNLAAARPFEMLPLMGMAVRDQLQGCLRQLSSYVKVMGEPGELAISTSSHVKTDYQSLVPEGVQWTNRVCARALLRLPFYRPITYAPRVQCPLLLCVGNRDTADSPQAALKTAQAAPYGEARRYDCDHYDFYAGEIFQQTVTDQCTFLVQHLLG